MSMEDYPPTSMQLVQREDNKAQALGYSAGSFSTKIHIKAEGLAIMNFVLTGGERHEAVVFSELVNGGKVKPLSWGR